MRTDDVVRYMVAQGATPGWLTPRRALVGWVSLLAAWTAFVLCYSHLHLAHRPPVVPAVSSLPEGSSYPYWSVLSGGILILLVSGVSGQLALSLSAPVVSSRVRVLAGSTAVLAVCALAVILNGYPLAHDLAGEERLVGYFDCPEHLIFMALPPAAAFFFLTRYFGQFDPLRIGVASLLASCAAGVLGLQLLCPNYSLEHVTGFHLFPVVLLTALGSALFSLFGGIYPRIKKYRSLIETDVARKGSLPPTQHF